MNKSLKTLTTLLISGAVLSGITAQKVQADTNKAPQKTTNTNGNTQSAAPKTNADQGATAANQQSTNESAKVVTDIAQSKTTANDKLEAMSNLSASDKQVAESKVAAANDTAQVDQIVAAAAQQNQTTNTTKQDQTSNDSANDSATSTSNNEANKQATAETATKQSSNDSVATQAKANVTDNQKSDSNNTTAVQSESKTATTKANVSNDDSVKSSVKSNDSAKSTEETKTTQATDTHNDSKQASDVNETKQSGQNNTQATNEQKNSNDDNQKNSNDSKEAKTTENKTSDVKAVADQNKTTTTTNVSTPAPKPQLASAPKPHTFSAFSSNYASPQQRFLNQIKAGAISGWNKYGVLPSISAAQAAVESGWGQSKLSTQGNNLFGIKGSYNGQSVYMPTQEYSRSAGWYWINAPFRQYPNWAASLEDHGLFLYENSRYANLLGVTDYRTVANLLHQDGYATAPTYANTLISVVQANGLTEWDNEAINHVHVPNNGNSDANINVTPENGTYKFTTDTNVRTAPNLNAPILGQYKKGESVIYNGLVSNVDGYNWLRYLANSGATHYVAVVNNNSNSNSNNNKNNSNKNNNNNTDPVTPAKGSYKFVVDTNVYVSPNTKSNVVAQYKAGQTVNYTDKVNANGYNWLSYKSGSGVTHFVPVLSKNTNNNGNKPAPKPTPKPTPKPQPKPVITNESGAYKFTAGSDVKTEANVNSQTVGRYEAGQTVYYNGKVKTNKQTWLRYKAISGATHYVQITNQPAPKPQPKPVITNKSGAYRFTAGTDVKTAANTNSQTVGRYAAGETVYYNGEVKVGNQSWLRYLAGSGATHYVQINNQPAPKPAPVVKNEKGAYRFTTATDVKTSASDGSQTVGRYAAGETVYYNGKVTTNGQTWLRYLAGSGATHYVHVNNNSRPAPQPTVTNASGAYTFKVNTNIRTAANNGATVVGQYRAGETVYYNGKVNNNGQTWLRYKALSGATHYVPVTGGNNNVAPRPAVSNATGAYRFTADTNIRTSASTSAPVVGQYAPGETVYYNGKVNADGYTWLRYKAASGATHYVAEVNGGSSSYTPRPVAQHTGAYTFKTGTNIRLSPNTNSAIVGSYAPGETVYYNGTVYANGYTWLRYRAASGATHYVAKLY